MSSAVTLPPVSNREDWDETFQLFDPDTGDVQDLSTVTALELIVWDPDTRESKITLALDSGLTIPSAANGIITLHVGESTMTALTAKNYAFRLGMTIAGAIKDIILPGILPIEDGGP
jgi:hypothetical protein